MITFDEFKLALEIVKKYREQCIAAIEEIDQSVDKHFKLRNTKLEDTDLSIRAKNVLFFGDFGLNQFDSYVKDLSGISINKLKCTRGLGMKSLREIKELCHNANILIQE